MIIEKSPDSIILEFPYKGNQEKVEVKFVTYYDYLKNPFFLNAEKQLADSAADSGPPISKITDQIEGTATFLSEMIISWDIVLDGKKLSTSYDDALKVVTLCPDYVAEILKAYPQAIFGLDQKKQKPQSKTSTKKATPTLRAKEATS